MDGASEDQEKLPPGFRFHPTDEELISYYLARKVVDPSFTGRAIGDVDLNKCEPWDLPGKAKMGEKEWYFFSLRERKYPTGLRTNRATDAGYWKTTGKDKEIYNSSTSELAGMKKTLVFYKGRAPKGEKTSWVMHEYRIQPKTTFKSAKDEWAVCRVFKKSSGGKKFPPNPARTNLFNLDMSQAALTSFLQPDALHVNMGRGYFIGNTDLLDLTRVLRGSGNMNLLGQPHLPFPAGLQQPAGLNLNLQNLHQSALPAAFMTSRQRAMKVNAPTSSTQTNFVLPHETCFPTELGGDGIVQLHYADAGQQLDECWPAPY